MITKKISLLEFENNSNIGLYLFINDKLCLSGIELDDKKKEEIEKIIQVPIYHITALNTQLLGVFLAGNNDLLIIPELLDYELSKLETICKKHNMKIIKTNEKLNTIGNNICLGNEEILISKEYNSKFEKEIHKLTGLKPIRIGNEEFTSIGGLCRFIDNKYFISQELNEEDFKKIIDKISGIGTVNSGSNFISSGIVGNKNGLLIGSSSTTIEIQNIVEAFE